MDRELEVIRDDMEQTRAKLADKLGALEQQVRETVSTASETVTSTVEGVKEVVDTVSNTVEGVTETFNISRHVEQHPWTSLGIALASGFALAQLFGGSSKPVVVQQPAPPPAAPPPQPQPQPEQHRQYAAAPQQQQKSGSILPDLSSLLPTSLLPSLESLIPDLQGVCNTIVSGLGGLAVGSVMGVVRDIAAKSLPNEWTDEVNKLVDQVTRQLGGKPQPIKQGQDGQDSDKGDEKSPEKKSQDRPQERGQQGGQRGGRNARQPAYPG